ncbi:hypothetical protein CsSME_00048663 [Camellia sinensis var. sinensis]
MVGVPKWLDQLTDAKFIDKIWEVGMRAKEDEKGVQVIDEFVERLKYSSNKKGLVKDVTNGHCCLGLSLIVLEMGKHLWSESEDELVEVNCPSCMRGIIHALDWHNSVKKVLPHKKHNGPKHTKVYFCNHSSRNVHNPTIHQGLLIASF